MASGRSVLGRFAALLCAVIAAGGCGETTDDSAPAGGAVGSGGSMAGAGSGGASGGSGKSGASGSSGALGSGASAGPGEPECTKDLDCVLINDCCRCKAMAASAERPVCGDVVCQVGSCEARQTGARTAICNLGRCVLDVSCDASKVTCERLPPQCPAGELPVVDRFCWAGGCVPASQCAGVTDCSQCGPELACVVADSLTDTFHCAAPAPSCPGDRSCACLGPSVCITPFGKCADSTPDRAVHCSCSTC